jgi:hypothetical protein
MKIAKYLFKYQSKKAQAKAGAKPGISSNGVGALQKPVDIDVPKPWRSSRIAFSSLITSSLFSLKMLKWKI